METDPNCSCVRDVDGNIIYPDPYCPSAPIRH